MLWSYTLANASRQKAAISHPQFQRTVASQEPSIVLYPGFFRNHGTLVVTSATKAAKKTDLNMSPYMLKRAWKFLKFWLLLHFFALCHAIPN